MKKMLVSSCTALFVLALSSAVFAVNSNPSPTQTKAGPAGQKAVDTKRPMRSNFLMMVGSVSKIDASNPAAVKVEVKDDRDGQIHIVEVAPSTNITKVTDISELKAGDAVRVMARKVDDKEVAMGIMFGNFKKLTPPAKLPPAQAKPAALKKEMPKK